MAVGHVEEKHLHAPGPKFLESLVDGGQGRHEVGGLGLVVVSNEADVLRDAQAGFAEGAQGP